LHAYISNCLVYVTRDTGLVAGVALLSVIAALLLAAIIIVGVFLLFDVRRLPLPGRFFLQKQSSVDQHTYQEINVSSVCTVLLLNLFITYRKSLRPLYIK